MRSIQLHVPSLAIGVAACALVLVSMSQAAPQISPPRVSYGPNPRDMVQIKEGTPYVVPTGTVFVLTALGSTHQAPVLNLSQLKVNGQVEVSGGVTGIGHGLVSTGSVAGVAVGFTANAGASLEVFGGDAALGSTGRAWGYLSR